MTRILIIAASMIMLATASPCLAQSNRLTIESSGTTSSNTSTWSRQYAEGWCAGYMYAQRLSMEKRDHYRAMLHYPAETFDQSMKRIYAKWPPDPPKGFDMPTQVDRIVNLEMAGIDLYVVLPPLDETPLQMNIADGKFSCPPKEAK